MTASTDVLEVSPADWTKPAKSDYRCKCHGFAESTCDWQQTLPCERKAAQWIPDVLAPECEAVWTGLHEACAAALVAPKPQINCKNAHSSLLMVVTVNTCKADTIISLGTLLKNPTKSSLNSSSSTATACLEDTDGSVVK